MLKKHILAICGSTRHESINLTLLQMLAEHYAEGFEIQLFDGIDKLPHFNPDLDKQNPPTIVTEFRELIANSDGVIICTPEYVFSLPGTLKNALDWTVSSVVFSDKPVALITAAMSGEKAHESLCLIMRTVGAKFSEQSQLLISGARSKVDKNGRLNDDTMRKLNVLMQALSDMM